MLFQQGRYRTLAGAGKTRQPYNATLLAEKLLTLASGYPAVLPSYISALGVFISQPAHSGKITFLYCQQLRQSYYTHLCSRQQHHLTAGRD
jgi:hypothetical protein